MVSGSEGGNQGEGEELLTLDEAARLLGLSRSTLHRMLRQGKLRGFKVGRQWRFRRAELTKFGRMRDPSAAGVNVAEIDEQLGRTADHGASVTVGPRLDGYPQTEEERAIERVLTSVLGVALSSSATDIHIDGGRGGVTVRVRIDGVLHEASAYPSAIHRPLVSCIKAHAGIRLDQQQAPQDGRFRVTHSDVEYDVRTATIPAVYGESVVMRLLGRAADLLTLDNPKLGMSSRDLACYRRALEAPMGMVIVSGPTGSGKTSVLYAGLQHIARPEIKAMTVEDPVEFSFPWVTQAAVNVRAGFTYEQATRALARHDPDVVMVGDIRTLPVAETCAQIAITGHLVMSTLHALSAAGAVVRLLEVGVEPFILAESLSCVVSMRLVRKVCPQCGEPDQPSPALLSPLANRAQSGGGELPAKPTFRRGGGCDSCHHTGYRGRTAIFEVLEVTPEISRLIVARAPVAAIQEAAVGDGMTTLAADGLGKAAGGITTVTEVSRVLPDGYAPAGT
jgi:excisionase family DNA binding protein